MVLELITAPDERERCCVLRCGSRCHQATALRFVAAGCDEHEQELYAYCCGDCAAEVAAVLGPGYLAARVG